MIRRTVQNIEIMGYKVPMFGIPIEEDKEAIIDSMRGATCLPVVSA